MCAIHTERAFETAIEEHLLTHGWHGGDPDRFDRQLAFDPSLVIAFITDTQPAVYADLKQQHGASLDKTLVEWLAKALDNQGMLHLLRHGFKFYGKSLRLAYFPSSHGLNPDLAALAAKNRLVVTRQVKFDPASEKSLDMVLSLNGLPIATVELKNPLTAQNVEHAIVQYRTSRDPRLPIFQFKKRTLVHFAVDPDVAYMATRLQGKDTHFLPFNRGNGTGAGNPDVKTGYKTSYLWEEVFERGSFLDILARFMHVSTEEKQVAGKKVTTETVIFPRYHQLDVVRRVERAARDEGPGRSYLIQHSAGSGKSNSIAWLAYRLAELHDAKDEKVFHSVVVVTDRRVLDRQLQNTIHQFEHKRGVVQKIDENSTQLAEALTQGTPIIVTTLQKFPFVAAKISELPNRAYAVIVDEAHSSQGGESAAKMKEILRARDLEAAARDDNRARPPLRDLRGVREMILPTKHVPILVIHWRGGRHSEHRLKKPQSGEHTKSASVEADAVIREMATKWSDEHVAATLNRMGVSTGQGLTWTAKRVGSHRRNHDIAGYESKTKDGRCLTMSEAAERLKVSHYAIRRLIQTGVLAARQVVKDAPWQIMVSDLQRPAVLTALRRRGQRPCRTSADERTLRIPGT